MAEFVSALVSSITIHRTSPYSNWRLMDRLLTKIFKEVRLSF